MEFNAIATHTLMQNLGVDMEQPDFAAAQVIARRLGAHYDGRRTSFGFWLPQLQALDLPASDIWIEILRPTEPIDLSQNQQVVTAQVLRLEVERVGACVFAVAEGIRAGQKDTVGDLYSLKYRLPDGQIAQHLDPLAQSLPFGAFAPAEVYDFETLWAQRQDKAYFATRAATGRMEAPRHVLQVHPHTATAGGTLADLTALFAEVGVQEATGDRMPAALLPYAHYDAVQLLPVMPQVDIEGGAPCFGQVPRAGGEETTLHLSRHAVQNWGYDIVIAGAAAINPSLLRTRRPDELLALVETLHNLPQPKQLILDIVYGHADNQAQQLLPPAYFLGPGMYGQEMNVQHPMVRAIMLESQRRIGAYGVDGFRVDAAQDIVYKDDAGRKHYDNDYLVQMNDLTYEVAGIAYNMWMVYEDGRPWPQPDWNIATTYRDVRDMLPEAYQWGPLTFVNNKPLIFGFWLERYWRVQEIARYGDRWVTGGSSHDTYRGLAHLDPQHTPFNTYLGEDWRAVAHRAYSNPAARLLDFALLPGTPMEFLNAMTGTPWGFLRNTDDHWGVKVMAEEAHFMDWMVRDEDYAQPVFFVQLKALGWAMRNDFMAFHRALRQWVTLTDYDLPRIVEGLQWLGHVPHAPTAVSGLKAVARAYFEDAYAYCNVAHHLPNVDERELVFAAALRKFRSEWAALARAFGPVDVLAYHHATTGAVIYYGYRVLEGTELLFVANMEGAPTTVTLADLSEWPTIEPAAWSLVLHTPGAAWVTLTDLVLADSEGAVWLRKRD